MLDLFVGHNLFLSLQDYEEDFEEFDEDKEEEEEEKGEEKEKEEEEVREDKSMEVRRELSPRSRREVEAIQRAIEQENELLSTAHSISSNQESEISLRGSCDLHHLSALGSSRDNQTVADKENTPPVCC